MSLPNKNSELSEANEKKNALTQVSNVDHSDLSNKEYSSSSSLNNHTKPARNGSNFGAFFNVVCAVAGAGVLGLPYATKQGGWASLFFILLAGLIAHTTGVQTVECLYYKNNGKEKITNQEELDRNRLNSIPEISEKAFGKIGKNVTLFFNFAIMLGFTCIDLILAGINLNAVSIYFGFSMDLKLWILIGGGVILIPYVLFKTLKEVAVIALFGAIATLVVVLVAIVMGLVDLPNHTGEIHYPIIWSGIPLSLSTISLSYGASVIFPHVEASMKQPKDWSKVLATSFGVVAFFYLFVSITGYLVYGENVGSPILESIPKGVPWIIATILITIHVVLAAPIYLCSFSIEFEKLIKIEKHSKINSTIIRIVTRVVTVGLLILVSMYVPFFNDFMSLVGSLANGFIIFLLPVFCHLKLFGFKGRKIYEYAWLVIIVIIGVLTSVLGTVQSIMALVSDFKH